MPVIPRKNYALQHLNEVRTITGIYNWFDFLDRKDRLIYLMELSRPTCRHYDDEPADFTCYCTWDFLCRLEWYGLWINKTPQEDWLFNEIRKLDREWSDTAGVLVPETQEAQAVLDKFASLIGLAKREILALND